MAVKILDDNNFKSEVESDTTLVQFHATWCGPCKMLSPLVDEYANETDIKVGKVDIDEAQEITSEYEIMSVPTLIVFKDGKAVASKIGFIPKEAIVELVDSTR